MAKELTCETCKHLFNCGCERGVSLTTPACAEYKSCECFVVSINKINKK